MQKRQEFICWNCKRTYSLFIEITDQQRLIVACPYCLQEGIVDLDPYRKDVKDALRSADKKAGESKKDLILPDILPTLKPE